MRVLAALLLAVPFSTLAQTTAPASPSAADPEWSLGAGVFFDFVSLRPGILSSSTTQIASTFVPGVTTSLERRLAPSTWLVLGATASWRDSEQDIPASASGISRWREGDLRLAGGVRQVLTDAGAPVEVSLLALADAGFSAVDVTVVQTGVPAEQRAEAWTAGASLGLALDRELTSRLSLRVASPLLRASYTSTSQRAGGTPTFRGHDFTAGLALAPRLELRLAF